MNPLISVIVPIYNVLPYLGECVESLILQEYDSTEIILVDDGSTDGSDEVCDEYAKIYPNIKVVHKKNAGLGMARNSGLEIANGAYVAFVDGDDFVSKDHISNLMNKLLKNKADACFGGYYQQGNNDFKEIKNPCFGKFFLNDEIKNIFIPMMCGRLRYDIDDSIPMSVCMGVYSMSIIKEYNLRFLSERKLISEDFIFNLDFLKFARTICVSEGCGYYYRYNPTSLTKKYLGDRLEKQIEFTKFIIERMKELDVYEKAQQRIYSTFLSWVRNIVKSEQENYKDIGMKKSVDRIKDVCNNDFVIEVLVEYDDSYLTVLPRVLNTLIRKKKSLCIWILSYIKSVLNK